MPASRTKTTARKARLIRACILLVFCVGLLLFPNPLYAASCSRLKARPNLWVAFKVDALVLAARAAYESDKALPAYEKTLDQIAVTIRKCNLSEDGNFINRYRAFVEYIEVASLYRLPNHELGFLVPDEKYFNETRRFVEIPEFLLEPAFLRSVSRPETLGGAKAFLRQVNLDRSGDEQLIFSATSLDISVRPTMIPVMAGF